MTTAYEVLRVLIVDDSAVIRGALGRIVDAEPDMTVVTTAPNGRVALDALRHTAVDVVLLDIEMPEMDGLAALPIILSQYPATRVIMASSLTQRGAEITMQAMALGAADYIAKPAARTGSATLAAVSQEIAAKIRAVGRAARARRHDATTRSTTTRDVPPCEATLSGALQHDGTIVGATKSDGPVPRLSVPVVLASRLAPLGGGCAARVLAIAASTGGPNALAAVLSSLPRDFPLPILVTQHMPPLFTALLAQRLERDAGRSCAEAQDGEPVLSNHTYVAPGGRHMVVETREGQPVVRLTDTAPENYCRPAADPMFRSVAAVYGASVLAVVLTGMGEDGLKGCRDVRTRGGRIIVQDEATSVVWGMPGAIANAGIAHVIAPLSSIPAAIMAQLGAVAA